MKVDKTKITVKIPLSLYNTVLEDLTRTHAFALERAGFAYAGYKRLSKNDHLIILNEYDPVEDSNYIDDYAVGGRIDGSAIRNAVNKSMNIKKGGFITHKHFGYGIPEFSGTDLKELPKIAETFCIALSANPHGLLLLSDDKLTCLVWLPGTKKPVYATKLVVVGNPINTSYRKLTESDIKEKRYSRQSFLGDNSQQMIHDTKIGVVGLGGGGSHIVQQLAHLGFSNVAVIDSDYVDESNLNRLVGATAKDANNKTLKMNVAKRVIKNVLPKSKIQASNKIWQESRSLLEDCDVIIGCLDSYSTRRDLENFCRRHLIIYLDIGMVVNKYTSGFHMVGQVISSIPGAPCMHCLGFLNENVLSEEAAKYGDAGEQPQVVWANGVLASTAIGVLVSIITGWAKDKMQTHYLTYNGNSGTVHEHPRLAVNGKLHCTHYPIAKSRILA